MLSGPAHVLALADLEQKVELLREERVVVVELESEQRKGLYEGAAADDHLRAAARNEIERRELLEQPHRIGRTEDRHRARQADALGACRSGSEDHCGSRVEELLAMVFTDAEHVQPDLIGVLDLVEQIVQTIRGTDCGARLAY